MSISTDNPYRDTDSLGRKKRRRKKPRKLTEGQRRWNRMAPPRYDPPFPRLNNSDPYR